jgi:RsiW-degrading membrane proteinase PrsW (M82 family)
LHETFAVILFALAIAPALAICIYIYWKDKFEKEPRRSLIWSFILGVASCFPAMALEGAAQQIGLDKGRNIMTTAAYAFLGVGLVEEGCKYFFTRFFAYRSSSFNEPFDGITYSVMVAMGFAAFENVMYVSNGGYSVALMRMVTAVPAHATFGIIIGYYLGLQKTKQMKYAGIKGLLLAAALHGSYDFFLFMNYLPGMWVGALLSLYIGLRFSMNAIKLHQLVSPFKVPVTNYNNETNTNTGL